MNLEIMPDVDDYVRIDLRQQPGIYYKKSGYDNSLRKDVSIHIDRTGRLTIRVNNELVTDIQDWNRVNE